MTRKAVIFFILVSLIAVPNSFAYILELTNSGQKLVWNLTRNNAAVSGGRVIYHIGAACSSDFTGVGGIPPLSQCFTIMDSSFQTWANVSTTKIAFTNGGNTAVPVSNGNDGVNQLFFVHNDPNLPSGVIALTVTTYTPSNGEILDSDIRFNETGNNFADPANVNYEDLQAVATHEIGHLFGLDHSFVAYLGSTIDPPSVATMFPFAETSLQKILKEDDRIGASVLYPQPTLATSTGSVSGVVAYLSGGNPFPVLGAHVVLLNPLTGQPVVAAVTDKTGNYDVLVSATATPAQYVVMCEPPLSPAQNLSTYYASSPTTYHPMLWDAHTLSSFSQTVPGQPAFDTAERVTVTLELETPNISFTTDLNAKPPNPSPPPAIPLSFYTTQTKHGGGGGGCSLSDRNNSTDIGLLVAIATPMIVVSLMRRARKRKAFNR